MRQRRTQESRSAETRERVVEAAIRVIAAEGYAAATTHVIATTAGVSRGGLQHQFRSRYDLMAAVIDQVMVDVTKDLDLEELGQAPLKERVERILTSYWVAFNSTTYRAALNIYISTSSDPTLRQLVEEHLDRIHRSGEAVWRRLFGNLGLPEGELFALRRIVVAAARGYAILGLGEAASLWRADLRTMVALVLSRLEGDQPA